MATTVFCGYFPVVKRLFCSSFDGNNKWFTYPMKNYLAVCYEKLFCTTAA